MRTGEVMPGPSSLGWISFLLGGSDTRRHLTRVAYRILVALCHPTGQWSSAIIEVTQGMEHLGRRFGLIVYSSLHVGISESLALKALFCFPRDDRRRWNPMAHFPARRYATGSVGMAHIRRWWACEVRCLFYRLVEMPSLSQLSERGPRYKAVTRIGHRPIEAHRHAKNPRVPSEHRQILLESRVMILGMVERHPIAIYLSTSYPPSPKTEWSC